MVFSNLFFLYVFIPLFALANIVFNKQKNLLLISFSIIFYAWGEPKYIFLLLSSILINYYLTTIIDKLRGKKRQKSLFMLCIVFNILLLVVFKYLNFFTGGLTHIPLPLGISFYTFQIISYICDVYKGEIKGKQKFTNFLLYVSMFPQLVAGPIVRYKDISKEIEDRRVHLDDIYDGVFRFIIGLGKKVLVADVLAKYVSTALDFNGIYVTGFSMIMGIFCFALEIYFDFSGYSDMAIGMGKCMGFNFKENFNYPLIESTMTDFWRRWHISLTSFFKDYVYIPLGGNKKHKILNIIIVWVLTGFWHGASLNFLLWGIFLAIIIIFEKNIIEKIKDDISPTILKLYFFVILILSFVLFYFEDISKMKEWFYILFTNSFIDTISFDYFIEYIWIFIIALISINPIYKYLQDHIDAKVFLIIKTIFIIFVLIISTIVLIGSTNTPFLYFRF